MSKFLPADSRTLSSCDRRRFLRAVGAAAGASLLPAWAHELLAAGPAKVPLWVADINGDGLIDAADLDLVMAASRAKRGFDVLPSADYDHRADLMARGRVDERDRRVFSQLLAASDRSSVRRPVTIAWHYGWYHKRHRTRQTCGFLGGNYLSRDPHTEKVFNDLKNECGVTVDALAWISPRVDGRMLTNYRRGYLSAKRLRTRHTALLYESRINLPRDSERIDFASLDVRGRLVEDFHLMGEWFRRLVDRGGRPFLLDGRPVVFLYASHTYIDDPESTFQVQALADAIEAGMERFEKAFGAPPFLVGEEMPLAPGDTFNADRQARTPNFDAVFAYHHAAHPTNIIHGGNKLGNSYAKRQQLLLLQSMPHIRDINNRFTGREVLVIPSLAPGFAKNGYRKLWATRKSYANYLREMHQFLEQTYYSESSFRSAPWPAPIYSVGSWNEEFEGHTLFPYSFNKSIKRTKLGGFDITLAHKEFFGWNVYAKRPLV